MVDPIEIKLTGVDDSAKAVQSAEGNLKDLGATAEKVTPKLKGVGDGVTGVGDKIRKGSSDTKEYSSRLDRAGEAGGNAESQFLGLGAGISGVSTMMKGGSLSAEEMAMATADIGDSIEHTVVPWLGKGKDAVAGLVDKLGGLKNVAIGAAGVAGVAALGFAIKEMDDAANTRNLDAMMKQLQATSFGATDANRALVSVAIGMGKLDEEFQRALAISPQTAEQFIKLAGESGATAEQIANMRDQLHTSTKAEKEATEASEDHAKALETEADKIRGVADARRAQIDPLYGMIDALDANREAQDNVNQAQADYLAAVKEHGRGSDEAREALENFRQTQDDATRSAFDYEQAAADLEAQIAEHPGTLANAQTALRRWVSQGLITEEQARRMAVRFGAAADSADDVAGTRTATLNAKDNASRVIRPVADRLAQLDGTNADVYITGHAVGASMGQMLSLLAQSRAAGGPIGAAAGGGVHRGKTLVGEGGPEFVDLQPGTMVTPASNTAQMLGAGAGGGAMRLYFDPTGAPPIMRAIMQGLRYEIAADGGDVQAVLGQR